MEIGQHHDKYMPEKTSAVAATSTRDEEEFDDELL